MTQRRMITIQRPLNTGRDGNLLAHWAVLVGRMNPPLTQLSQFDILIEAFAETNPNGGRPLLVRRVTTDARVLANAVRPFTIFGRDLFTSFTNAQLTSAADTIITRNRYYNFATNNCQHFVRSFTRHVVGPGSRMRRFALELPEDIATIGSYPEDGKVVGDELTDEELEEIIPSLDNANLELCQSKFAEFNTFLASQKLPTIDELLNLWAQTDYEDMTEGILEITKE